MRFEKIRRIENLFFFLLIFFLPTQLGKHFWPSFSFVEGLRVDYLSPTIYVTDFLFVVLFIFWGLSKNFKREIMSLLTNHFLQLFLLSIVISILLSNNYLVGLFGFIKLVEFILFGYYVSIRVKSEKLFRKIAFFFSLSVIFESVVAIYQFKIQSSIGGILYYFGERTFNSQTPGIANASLSGDLILRPYGTFPHPNVLGGFLVIAFSLIITAFIVEKAIEKKILFLIALFLGFIALCLTMSRPAIISSLFLFLVSSILYFKKRFGFKKVFFPVLIFVLIALIFFSPLRYRFFGIQLSDESITLREKLSQVSFTMIKISPLFGVGYNNFLPSLSEYQKMFIFPQPVHNIFLLVITETGFSGLIFLLLFLFKTFKNLLKSLKAKKYFTKDINFQLMAVFIIILFIGLFDHYFLTLQQGQLLLSFILGLCWAKAK